MKNKSSKLLVLSLAALLGVACSPAILPSDSQGVGESILVDGEGEADEIGLFQRRLGADGQLFRPAEDR